MSCAVVPDAGEESSIRLEPLKNTHLPGKATPSRGCGRADLTDKVAVNGLHDIEDRILRITGYYGYNPGYSSHRRDDENEVHAETPGSDSSTESRSYHTCTSTALKVLGGLLMVLCVSSSWVGTTQVVKLTFQSFSCPFFISWFSSNWNILFFPLYYSGHFMLTREKQTPIQKFRECSRLFGEDGMTLKLFVKRTAPFSILWTLTNYLYLLALKKLTATDVSALYCCHKAFVFLLSWIVLKDRFMGVRIVAAIMAITGIVMMAYADGFHGDSFVGVALAVGSASTSALYKVGTGTDAGERPKLTPPCRAGSVQDVPRQRQPGGGGPLPVHHGLLQPHLHLTGATHPLLHQDGTLGVAVLAAVGLPVWTGRTLAGVQRPGARGGRAHVPHPHLHRNAAQRAGERCRGRAEARGHLQRGASGRHLRHLPGLPPAAAARGVGRRHAALPGRHRRQEVRGPRRGADGLQRPHQGPQPGQRRRLHPAGVTAQAGRILRTPTLTTGPPSLRRRERKVIFTFFCTHSGQEVTLAVT
ncbi:uncharacterized protein slc35f4 isoform 1-T1 [Synchiropus picturatus]